ncbi:MAG: hypothetical protein IJ609_04715, partial [Paludibacteraceae bacterium]|nr:hypothetical protein [Paludibacteraceae bacterium]
NHARKLPDCTGSGAERGAVDEDASAGALAGAVCDRDDKPASQVGKAGERGRKGRERERGEEGRGGAIIGEKIRKKRGGIAYVHFFLYFCRRYCVFCIRRALLII